MNLVELKKRGFKIATKWQECNKKSIFLYDNDSIIKFKNYINSALKKDCKFIICNIKLKNKINPE